MTCIPRSLSNYGVVTMLAIGGATLAAQRGAGTDQLQNPTEPPQLRMRLNGVEVDMLQTARGGVVLAQPQGPFILGSDPLTLPVVKNAPYSGQGVTVVTQTLGDGTRIEQGATAKFFRDSSGRVRREQTIIGLAPLNLTSDAQTVVTIDPDPTDQFAYQLDASSRTARRVMRGGLTLAASALSAVQNDLAALTAARGSATVNPGGAGGRGGAPQNSNRRDEDLGTRQFEGVRATGTKTTQTIPVGQIGNDRAIEITDERWVSPELQVIVYSRHSDPRTGVVEYKLTGISRMEPADYLFQVPSDYTVIEAPVGMRTGGPGAGGRGTPGTAGDGGRSTVPPGTRGRQP